MSYIKIKEDLYLVCQEGNTQKSVTNKSNHYIFTIDCSGSMSKDLPLLRTQLKNKLPLLVKELDIVSLIWFSGKNQCGVIFEGLSLRNSEQLKNAQEAIDRFLQPKFLTGFLEPLQLVSRVCDAFPTYPSSLFFLTDGWDNQCSRSEIENFCALDLSTKLSNSAMVEYGYYCDRDLIRNMAEALGGVHIFSSSFEEYEPILATVLASKVSKKCQVELEVEPIRSVISLNNGLVEVYKPENKRVLVPENATIYYLSKSPSFKGEIPFETTSALYALMSQFSKYGESSIVYDLISFTGDIRFSKIYTNAFGKQTQSNFQAECVAATFDPKKRLVDGYDRNVGLSDTTSFTIFDLLYLLNSDDTTKIYPFHEKFEYNRTSKAKKTKSQLSTEYISILNSQLEKATEKEALELLQNAGKIANREALTFMPSNKEDGFYINDLVYAEGRCNASIRVKMSGTVDLSDITELPVELRKPFETFVYRNYTVVKDGLINFGILPVSMSQCSFNALVDKNIIDKKEIWTEDRVFCIDLLSLPLINRQSVTTVSVEKLAKLEYALLQEKAAQKVYNYMVKELLPDVRSKGLVELYGENTAAVLKTLGITDSGFNPPTESIKSTDIYVSAQLKTSFEGLSSLPSIKELEKSIESGKPLTKRMQLIHKSWNDISTIFGIEKLSELSSLVLNDNQILLILDKQKAIRRTVKELMSQTTIIKSSVILSQTWFNDLESKNDTTYQTDNGTFKVELVDVEISI